MATTALQSSSADEVASGIHEILDVMYDHQDSVRQSLSAFLPIDADHCPVMVLLHGGGWIHGDKASLYDHARRLAADGVAVVVPNYRLSPAAQFPAHSEDVAAAIAWTHSHAPDWGGDPDSLYLVGHSAGAHLAALMAVDTSYLGVHGLSTDVIAGLLLVSGVYEIMPQDNGATPEFISMIFGPDSARWTEASPIAHVSSIDHHKLPPILLAWADREDPLMVKESVEFRSKLRTAGQCVHQLTLSGSDHAQGLSAVNRSTLTRLHCGNR